MTITEHDCEVVNCPAYAVTQRMNLPCGCRELQCGTHSEFSANRFLASQLTGRTPVCDCGKAVRNVKYLPSFFQPVLNGGESS